MRQFALLPQTANDSQEQQISWTRFAVITAIYVILALWHLCFGMAEQTTLEILTKGFPIVLLCICTAIWGRRHPLVIAALFFSFLGDYGAEISIPGCSSFQMMVIFFACAQICYIREFLRYRPAKLQTSDNVLSLTPVFCSVYAILLLGNVISSCRQKRIRKWAFVTGSFLFLISDSLILVRMLTGGFHLDSLTVMITYYAAQYLLNIFVVSEK